MFAETMSEADVMELLCSPEVSAQVGSSIGDIIATRAMNGRRADIFTASATGGEFVIRFARDEVRLANLRKEERIQRGLRSFISHLHLRVPDTRVVTASDSSPVFAVHTMIPGRDWFNYEYSKLSGQARDRLVSDLVEFLLAIHSVPLRRACEWMNIVYNVAYNGDRGNRVANTGGANRGDDESNEFERAELTATSWLASTFGKPDWFEPNWFEPSKANEIRR